MNDKNTSNHPHQLILCAGIPRSGSTWIYNATRLLLQHKYSDADVYGCWISDYDNRRLERFHVVKIHEPNDGLSLTAQTLITSCRDLRDIAASAWLRGWVTNKDETKVFLESAVSAHEYWKRLGALDLDYDGIRDTPLITIKRIAKHINCNDSSYYELVVKEMEELPTPNPDTEQYNSISLLHDRHRRNGRSGYFTEVLPIDIIAHIEFTFREWLRARNFLS